jgi:NADH-quinone oxidoreductase subunit L
MGAIIGCAKDDIKKALAGSTMSQIGYMILAAGLGPIGYVFAIFHLLTHGFFKATMFLGAGSVIHAMHHEQDMRYYGGLRTHIPLTFWAMMAGTLAITGVGIVDVAGFAGFYSKDAILEAAYARSTGLSHVAFFIGIFAALLTSFYSWRLMFLTFWGKPRWEQSEHIQHAVHEAHGHGHDDHAHGHGGHAHSHGAHDGTAGYHPHESPLSMLLPLGLLSIGAVLAGFVFHGAFISEGTGEFWKGSLAFSEHLIHAMHEVPEWVKWAPFGVMAIGLAIAFYAYIANPGFPAAFIAQIGPLYQFLLNKWYFDELYNAVFVKPAMALGRMFWQHGDIGIIDKFGPNGAAWVVARSSKLAVRMQSGYLNSYALVMLVGLVGVVSWVIAR